MLNANHAKLEVSACVGRRSVRPAPVARLAQAAQVHALPVQLGVSAAMELQVAVRVSPERLVRLALHLALFVPLGQSVH